MKGFEYSGPSTPRQWLLFGLVASIPLLLPLLGEHFSNFVVRHHLLPFSATLYNA